MPALNLCNFDIHKSTVSITQYCTIYKTENIYCTYLVESAGCIRGINVKICSKTGKTVCNQYRLIGIHNSCKNRHEFAIKYLFQIETLFKIF